MFSDWLRWKDEGGLFLEGMALMTLDYDSLAPPLFFSELRDKGLRRRCHYWKATPTAREDAQQGQAFHYKRRDHMTSMEHSETEMVDQVSESKDEVVRIPQIGDEARSERNCGHDMRTRRYAVAEGVAPDIIVNPHVFHLE
ncbi:hypothetical protein C5167_027965 [Papaver somniferum]|nr:hypothetical protein C5167_027965 [Papaver somniferum]